MIEMRVIYTVAITAILFMGLLFSAESMAGVVNTPPELVLPDQKLDRLQYLTLQDAVSGTTDFYGNTPEPEYQPLEVHRSDDSQFDYMAQSPYYKVFFKGRTLKVKVKDAWIELELAEDLTVAGKEAGPQESQGPQGESKLQPVIHQNSLSMSEVFESVDLSYKVDTSLFTETFMLKEWREVERIIHTISWGGMTPEYQEDDSILFLDENGKELLKILPPFMEDAAGAVCTDLHYELLETESGHELHKVIREEGLEWLKTAVYPVVIDPTIETIEDAWTLSGFTTYGQYTKAYPLKTIGGGTFYEFSLFGGQTTGLNQCVNPANGHQLTLTETDLVIPGRGLDIKISRIYETPAVFYGSSPYDYEAPPVDIGKSWQLNFPYVGSKYLHLWGGTIYKIEWSGNTFENHTGTHFTLVKNGDNTYTLTTASGAVYEFNTDGKITTIKDLDQNTISFTYTSGDLTSITDSIGRTVSFTYSSGRLSKITYNSAEIEYSYDANGCLVWVEDFLNRRTSYYYNTGYNYWLLSKVEYPSAGYTTYTYDRYEDESYYKYHVTDEKVYETNQVRHYVYSYTGTFDEITYSTITVKNQSDVTQGSYYCTISDGLVTQRVVKNGSGTPIRKYTYTYSSNSEVNQESVYNDGTNLSYTNYYAYDNWGNLIYFKNAEGHERFFSYANTDTSGIFLDNNGNIIKKFTNAFSNSSVPSSVHTALLGSAEKQDSTYMKETYVTYDSEAHPTQFKNYFGNETTYLTYSGTFNEKTGNTSFSVDLTGHTVTGNGILQITGLASDDNYTENHSYTPSYGGGCKNANWNYCGWQYNKYKTYYTYTCGTCPNCDVYQGWAYIGPFTHYPGTLGYQSTTTNPSCDQQAYSFSVTAYWKAYPAQVKYNLDNTDWITVTSDLSDGTAKKTVPITNGSHTLYFSESSPKDTKFSWYLYVPVDNTPDTCTTTMTYDSYGNVTSITDAESNTASLTYSSTYSYAYLTETSATIGSDTITTKMTYDSNRGWITSIQQPEGVDAGSGYDYLFTYDLLGRVTKQEFPLLSGQSQRSYVEYVYDDTNRMTTTIDTLRHYIVQQYDKLGRPTDTKWYAGTYGSGTLYATMSYAYRYDDKISTVTDPGSDQTSVTYDFLGRITQITYPGSVSVSYSYDDTNNKTTFANGRGYDTIYWFDWLTRLEKVEEEYATDTFAVTTYQYDEIGHLTSFTDAENHTTSYTYASDFGLTKTTYADSEYEEYAYNDVGKVTTFTDCKGNDIAFTYDDLYRLTQVEYEDQSTVTYTYDLNSNRTKMEDDIPNTDDYVEYSYDKWNRVTSETRHISTSTYTVSREYDVASRLTELTYPDSMQILYSYDDLNRITEIKRYVDGSNDEILLDSVQYDTESLLTQFDYGNDLQATLSYDSRDRLSTLDVKNGTTSYLDLDYTYDSSNNITQLVNGWRNTSDTWHSETESYSYDGLDRLTSASCTSWSHTYTYDKVGNRTAKDSVTYTINTVNEVTALSDGTSFTYDDNGNRTQKTKGTDTWDYTYDYANRLTKVEENSETIGEYVYDGDGKRLQVTENSVTTTYIYAGYGAIYEENSTGTACYIYGPTGLLAKRTTIDQQSDTYYYHTDHLGSVRQATDSSKNIVSAITYLPFGETSTEQGSEHYLFNGKEQDTTGLHYYGARYYDSDVGRFITKDPLQGRQTNPQSLNRYTYCLNNPLKIIDPWGEKNFYIEGGGEQEEPEITGDPSYDGNGEITIPTSMGDVTIDLDTEDWGDVDDKAKQNQVRDEFEKLQRGREQYREYQRNQEMRNRSKLASQIGVAGLIPQGWISLFAYYGSKPFYAANLGARIFSYTVGYATAPLTEFIAAKAVGYNNTEAAVIAGASLAGTAIGMVVGGPIGATIGGFIAARFAEYCILKRNY
jgi:RHS repeat-associated protein